MIAARSRDSVAMAFRLPPLDLRGNATDVEAAIVNAPGHDLGRCRPAAAEGHVHRLFADRGIDQRAAQMRGRADPGGTELHLGVVRFDVSDEFLEVRHRQILARDQHHRLLGDQADRREIADRIVGEFLVDRRVVAVRADAGEQHGVARRALRGRRGLSR
ncbi:MAG TPA: hypothetical protein VFC45_04425 [Pseudolabrys sp.]|nr:hypothetical protein [Pseudolabrys sp.]